MSVSLKRFLVGVVEGWMETVEKGKSPFKREGANELENIVVDSPSHSPPLSDFSVPWFPSCTRISDSLSVGLHSHPTSPSLPLFLP